MKAVRWIALLIAFATGNVFTSAEPADLDAIICSLTTGNTQDRREAAARLADRASSDAAMRKLVRADVARLIQIVGDRKEDSAIRSAVVRTIAIAFDGDKIDKSRIPPLVAILLDEKEDQTLRSSIAMVLPDLGEAEAVGPALLIGARSANRNVRVNSAQQLGRIQLGPKALLPWAEKAILDPVPQVRMCAITVVSTRAKEIPAAKSILVRGLADDDSMIRRVSTDLITATGVRADKDVVAGLKPLLSDADPEIRLSAASALLKMTRDDQYVTIILRSLESDDVRCRRAAARALTANAAEAKAVVPALTRALNDADERVRVQAAGSLLRIVGVRQDFLAVLKKSRDSEDPETMGWARFHLAAAGSPP